VTAWIAHVTSRVCNRLHGTTYFTNGDTDDKDQAGKQYDACRQVNFINHSPIMTLRTLVHPLRSSEQHQTVAVLVVSIFVLPVNPSVLHIRRQQNRFHQWNWQWSGHNDARLKSSLLPLADCINRQFTVRPWTPQTVVRPNYCCINCIRRNPIITQFRVFLRIYILAYYRRTNTN